MKTKLLIIHDIPRSAAFNMAADLHLLSVCTSKPVVFLRLYKWTIPSITLGYTQKPEYTIDIDKLNGAGYTWIRRPTGGRAVFHHGDITYSTIFSKKIIKMGKSITETYQIISNCLIKGLQKSGINCVSQNSFTDLKEIKHEIKLPCFITPNRHEILVNRKKLVGSAQKRTNDAVLQHGSIPITGDFRNLPLYQKTGKKEKSTFIKLLHEKCTCVEECLNSFNEKIVVENIKSGFMDFLPFKIETYFWSDKEENEIKKQAESYKFISTWMN